MPFAELSNDGVLNGVNDVDLVAVPAAATKRLVRHITVFNADTAAIDLLIEYHHAANQRMMYRITLNPDETWVFGEKGEIIVLDDVDKSVVAHLGGAVAANQPHFTSHYGDVT